MPVTDADRIFARNHADTRQKFHDARNDYDKKISTTLSGAEVHYRGLLGECEFVRVFGGSVDVSLRPNGDGKRDFMVKLIDRFGRRIEVPIDVKVSSYNGGDPFLRVPCADIARFKPTIYIDGHYHDDDDDVYLRGWQWGQFLIARNQVMTFSSRGTPNFLCPCQLCRKIDELIERAKAAADVRWNDRWFF